MHATCSPKLGKSVRLEGLSCCVWGWQWVPNGQGTIVPIPIPTFVKKYTYPRGQQL